jgi:hypothetical protein
MSENKNKKVNRMSLSELQKVYARLAKSNQLESHYGREVACQIARIGKETAAK